MSRVLFVGPSLPGLWASPPPGIELRPPAARGDLLRALREGATAIGVADGLFGSVPSIWHKEILLVLDAGVPVLGAASMGALRVAECAAFGMEPVGEVAAAYLEGRLERDDAVAVLHAGAEHGWHRLSDALVDLVDLHAAAAGLGLIAQATAARLDAIASRLHWTDRRIDTVAALAGAEGVAAAELAALGGVASSHVGVKARDTALLAERLAQGPVRPAVGAVGVHRTLHVRALLRDIAAEGHPWGRVLLPPSGSPRP